MEKQQIWHMTIITMFSSSSTRNLGPGPSDMSPDIQSLEETHHKQRDLKQRHVYVILIALVFFMWTKKCELQSVEVWYLEILKNI
jgi:hypothetical protein